MAKKRSRGAVSRRAAILLVAGVLAYWPAFSAPFLLDDRIAILNNAQIRTLTPLSSALSAPRDTPVAGRPLVNLSFAINYAADALNPRGYRMTNLAIHLVAGLLLFGVIRRTLLLPKLSRRFGNRAPVLAFAAALLWTLHPLHSEVINYVTQRTESMMGLCYFATLYCSVRALAERGIGWTVSAVLSCAAGMLCKESMVTAPLAVVLIDRVLVFDSWREAFTARWRLYGGLAATWLVLVGLLAGSPRSSAGFGSGISPWVYLLNQTRMIVQYLKLAAWPRGLVLDYGLPQPLTVADIWLSGLVVVALLLATVVALVFRPALGLLGAWFFMTLSPTSSFVPISTEVGAERRMYLPLVAIVVLVVIAFDELRERVRRRGQLSTPASEKHYEMAVLALLGALMVGGILLRNREYESMLTMSQTIVSRWPSGRGLYHLGTTLIESGRESEGMSYLRASSRDYPGALFAIGTEQFAAGKTSEAIATVERFIRALPTHVNVIAARDMLARAYAIQGNLAAAEDQARQLVKLAPTYAAGHDILGRLLGSQGQFLAAAAEFQQVLALQPGNVAARQNLEAMQRLAADADARTLLSR
jgi:protein O-mannosyl-transferase